MASTGNMIVTMRTPITPAAIAAVDSADKAAMLSALGKIVTNADKTLSSDPERNDRLLLIVGILHSNELRYDFLSADWSLSSFCDKLDLLAEAAIAAYKEISQEPDYLASFKLLVESVVAQAKTSAYFLSNADVTRQAAATEAVYVIQTSNRKRTIEDLVCDGHLDVATATAMVDQWLASNPNGRAPSAPPLPLRPSAEETASASSQ